MADESTSEYKTGPAVIKIGIYSLAVNLVLVAVKLTLSIMTGSLALRADAVHSVVDVVGSIALILGLIISGRKSKEFPYGLHKVENIVAVAISLLLFFTAYELLMEAIVGGPASPRYDVWVLAVVAVMILVPFFFGRYEANVGKRISSPSLIADGNQFRVDVLSASVVFFALVGQHFGLPLDRIAAGIVAALIGYTAYGLLASGMRVLLDASVNHETLERIRSLIISEPAVSVVAGLTARNSGRYIFIEATVTMRVSDLRRAHIVSQRIESKIKGSVRNVDRVLIHYEPSAKTGLRYAVALADRSGLISEHFGESPYFALIDIHLKEKRVQRQELLPNPYVNLRKGKGIQVAQLLLGYKPDIVLARESLSGKGPGYAFAEAGTETTQTEARSLDDLIDQLIASLVNE